MKLWIDDLRPAPDSTWTVAVDSGTALEILAGHPPLEEVSFDHDLGGDDTTRRVLTWMVENNVWPATIVVHTANPVGRKWLVGTARRYAPATVRIVG